MKAQGTHVQSVRHAIYDIHSECQQHPVHPACQHHAWLVKAQHLLLLGCTPPVGSGRPRPA